MAKKKQDPIKLKGVTKKGSYRYTQDPNDPALKAYQDSLYLYNEGDKYLKNSCLNIRILSYMVVSLGMLFN